jgi:3D (Asp-Asp-Asp) domain-containing protein
MFQALIVAVVVASGLYPLPADITKADFEPLHEPKVIETRQVWVTSYSSSVDETDDTPFLTASGTETRDGVAATNMYPFGTKIRIPGHFGNKIFTVEDRMHPRKKNVVDVWMPSKQDAIVFGAHYTEIEIVEEVAE